MSISLAVYEDQTGKMLYPEKRPGGDDGIRKFFAGHTLLSMAKEKNRLQFLCRVFAKDSERINGYYVACEGEYVSNIFDDFKEKSKEILKKLGLELSYIRTSDEIFDSNSIFDNIEKFGSVNNEYMQHADDATNILMSELADADKRLEYKAGKVDKIAKFCKEMLKLDKIEINVSSRKSMYGDINIIVENYNGNFSPTEKTIQFLDKYNGLMEKKRKEEDDRRRAKEAESNAKKIEDGKDKIRKNFLIMASGDESKLIRSEIQSLEDAGYNSVAFVKEEIDNFYGKVATEKMRYGKGADNNKGKYKNKSKDSSSSNYDNNSNNYDSNNDDDKKGKSILWSALLVTVGLILGIVMGTFVIYPYLLNNKYMDSGKDQTPVPTDITANITVSPTPTSTVTTIPTPTVTTTPTSTPTVTQARANNSSTPIPTVTQTRANNSSTPIPTVTQTRANNSSS